MKSCIALLALAVGSAAVALAVDSDRDFSGKWVLDPAASNVRALPPVETSLTVTQSDAGILCSTGSMSWSYALDGSETRKRVGEDTRLSAIKWEGRALLVNTLVSGSHNHTVMDRWVLSRDRARLIITRQVVTGSREVEGTLVFRREGAQAPAVVTETVQLPAAAAPAPPAAEPSRPTLMVRRPEAEERRGPEEILVPQGTRILLTLVSEVSTKTAQEGDHVYLRTDSPVAVGGRIVIPRGSDVGGSITRTKAAGKVHGKGELFVRFDSLTLPNGTTRDFRARTPRHEGEIDNNGKSADAGMVMAGAGMGATVGAITRGLGGAAVGGAAGALAGVLMSRNQNIVLRPGTHLEMVLDRDLVFRDDELTYRVR